MNRLARLDDRLFVDERVSPAEFEQAMRDDARQGLCAKKKELAPMYLYDARGSELFEAITRIPAYYLTRCETTLLRAHANEIANITTAATLVELGSGTSAKTRTLLDALSRAGTLKRFVPIEINKAFLISAARAICSDYPKIMVHGLVGDFNKHVEHIPDGQDRLFAFLGSTIGNLYPKQRARFFADVRKVMRPGERLLLGTDLVKSEERLLAAYDDAEGITAEFVLNLLSVLNKQLGGNFDRKHFAYEARWNEDEHRLELGARSLHAQTVHIESLDLDVAFAPDEILRAEICTKFTQQGVQSELNGVGFTREAWWTDNDGDYALSLWHRS